MEGPVVIAGEKFHLRLDQNTLLWSDTDSSDELNNKNVFTVPIEEVITSEHDEAKLTVHYIKRLPKHVWGHEQTTFVCESSAKAEEWATAITRHLSGFTNRPKNLLVFINPSSGGGGKGEKVFSEVTKPLFDLAGITYEVVVTSRGGEASDMVQSRNLSEVDGIVAIGGDGTLHEVANGLLRRSMADANLDIDDVTARCPPTCVRLANIAGGSANIHNDKYTIGTIDPTTATLHVILGDEIAVDVMSIYHNKQFVSFILILISYGVTGDMLQYTEPYLRWMGRWRYIYGLLRAVVKSRTFNAEFDYVPARAYHEDEDVRNGTKEAEYKPTPHLIGTDEHIVDEKTGRHRLKGKLHNFVVFAPGSMCKGPTKTDPRPYHIRTKEYLGNGTMFISRHGPCSRTEFLSFVGDAATDKAPMKVYPYINSFGAKEVDVTIMPDGDAEEARYYTADGENTYIEDKLVFNLRMHQQSLRLFVRGMEPPTDTS